MAESLEAQQEFAEVYAAALFALATEAGRVSAVQSELDELVKAEEADADYSAFLTSGAFSEEQRAATLEKLFRGKLSDLTLNTLLVMNRNGRSGLTKALRRAFELRAQTAANEVEASVVSAVKLSDAEREQVEAAIGRVSGKKPLVAYRVDSDILGGLIVQVGGLRYDNSLSRQLRLAHRQIRERSERGLEVGVTD